MMNGENYVESQDGCDIAIIGMDGRFPGASDVAEFWRNLKQGVEGISFFSDEELEEPVDIVGLNNPEYIKAHGVLKDVELFDASFFNIPAREAQWMDPQHRLFLECAWSAIENAGYNVESYKGLVAVYAGLNANTYILSRLDQLAVDSSAESFLVYLASDKDYLATRVSYKLNLRGESITIQTACSTSLVAVHLACQSLLSGQSDMALAGGVSVRLPQKTGYFFSEGMIVSPDGHCRPFDRKAQGTLPGNGLGVVVLKRLADALEDGDHIHALIKGSAVNNDGRMKMGYTAPSVEGQADVIAKALAMAGVEPDTIGLLEAHGTATQIGDPIEVEALTRVFRRHTSRRNFCALGSVKSNIGHLDNAAGVAGLIKAVLALEHKQIPPTLHFERANPTIGLEASPFFVNSALIDWEASEGARRAGVSSFGIGGTNAHVVLEEAPSRATEESARPFQLLTLSARTPAALDRMRLMLADQMEREPHMNLADASYTRNAGRQAFAHRRFVVARDGRDAVSALREPNRTKPSGAAQPTGREGVVFMFPGQGVSCLNAARQLYECEPSFRASIDGCSDIMEAGYQVDLRRMIYPAEGEQREAADRLARPEHSLPALLAVEVALARLWMSWGITPRAMIGHSFGEYAAACLAGVFSLEDALRLAVARGRLIQSLPPGTMLAARVDPEKARLLINEDVTIASINSDDNCVFSGPVEAIERLARRLQLERASCRRLEVAYAYHSSMVEPILPGLASAVAGASRTRPEIGYISSRSGTWIRDEEATSPDYWAEQMREPVRFASGLDTLAGEGAGVFLEVGPGQTLSMMARQHLRKNRPSTVLASLNHAGNHSGNHAGGAEDDLSLVLETLGRMWAMGIEVDWPGFYAFEKRRRVPLPTYPFERKRHWIDARRRPDQASSQAGVQSQPARASANELQEIQREELFEDYLAPRNEIEEALAEIWEEVLGLRGVGINDDLFELGGDSLLATRIFSRIKHVFSIEISLEQILRYRTISELSQAIQRGGELEDAQLASTYYCSFDISVGDEKATVFMPEPEYRRYGLPEGASNFRFL